MVPGGRFIENYYWDTYWICLGLLATGKPEIVKDTLINFFYLVERCGFIPNGTRMYYQDRSQPPILSSLLRAYFYETHDLDFIAEHVKDLEKEYNFWMNQQFKHCITVTDDEGKSHTLNRYYSSDTEPRPESYRMDYEVGKVFVAINRSTDDELRELFRNIHAGAESGWDFSARWLRPAVELMSNLKVCNIILGNSRLFDCGVLGSGYSGEVKRVEDENGGSYALKVSNDKGIHFSLTDGSGCSKNTLILPEAAEFERLRKLYRAGIPVPRPYAFQIYSNAAGIGNTVMLMDLVKGQTLRDWLSSQEGGIQDLVSGRTIHPVRTL
ncbi:trehalase-like [Dermatophagoides farinae]|uniref:trehalase-like n=1 Tax=Dermatophagoides farinae TaxID=6954 RepID=UPI003F5FDEEA